MENKRLTRKGTTKIHLEDYLMNGSCIDIQDCLNKLGKIEDLIESYNVKDLEELDKLLEMATSYEGLYSKQIGCSLEVLQKITKGKQIYIDTYTVQRPSGANMIISKGMYNVIGIDILKNQIQCLAQFSDCYMEFYVPIYEYKVEWFLKEDKSE